MLSEFLSCCLQCSTEPFYSCFTVHFFVFDNRLLNKFLFHPANSYSFLNMWPQAGQLLRYWIFAQTVSKFWLKTSAPPSKTTSVNPITSLPAHPLHMPSADKHPPGVKLKWNISLQNIFGWEYRTLLRFSGGFNLSLGKCSESKQRWNVRHYDTAPGVSQGSELISCQNFTFFFLLSTNFGASPSHLPSPLLSPRSAFEDGARRESAWLALDTKGGLFHEMFPFLMSDGVRSFNIPHWYLSGSWLCFKATAWL